MADTLITLLIALTIIFANLAMLVWIIADTYKVWQFRQRLYAPVKIEAFDEAFLSEGVRNDR